MVKKIMLEMGKTGIIKKLQLMEQLFNFAYEVKKTQLEKRFPDYDQTTIKKMVLDLMDKSASR